MKESDKELLELAAKSIGMKTTLLPSVADPDRPYERPWQIEDSEWNPLEDDGDALRLAVKLGLNVYGRNIGCSVDEGDFFDEADFGGDYFKAARYAIVSRAAEIGKAMP